MKHVLILLTLTLSTLTTAPYQMHAEQVHLDSLIREAYENFRFADQMRTTDEITQMNVDRWAKTYLPSVELNAVSTYQNEQISIPVGVQIPGFEPPAAPLNLNNALLTLRQWIYDGSMMANQQDIEEATGEVRKKEIEVRRLELKTSVMQLFFGVLLADKQTTILEEKMKVLEGRLNEVEVAVRNYVLLASDADMLKAEIVQLRQAINEAQFKKREAVRGLEKLSGRKISEGATFITPVAELTTSQGLDARPDIQLLDVQKNLLEEQKGSISSLYLPRIGVFADLGAGLPGYDIFDDNIAPMAKVGLTFNWKIFDWDQGGMRQQTLDMSKQLLSLQQDQIKAQVSVRTEAQLNTIEKAQALLDDDEELVRLYGSVAKSYASQLDNGTITSADYLMQLNKEQTAKTNLELHRLQLLIATMNYNTLLGQ